MKRSSLLLLLPAALACGQHAPLLKTVEPPTVHLDAGVPPTPPGSCAPIAFGGPSCCGATGLRVSSASCVDGEYRCSLGAVCACLGQPQPYFCTDFCGSDAYVEPLCGAVGWYCEPGLKATSDCPADTCWGEPGELCARPTCVDGAWVCADADGGIDDPET